MDNDWKEKHGEVINGFLDYLNKQSNQFILKGGTALMACYGLSRFSEDIDLDSTNKNQFFKIVDTFCKKNDYEYRIAKDTDTTKRAYIHYKDCEKPLKVELSLRNKFIDESTKCTRNGITVYNIDTLASLKTAAYAGRDKIRDLYDVVFICNNYWNELSPSTKILMQATVGFKGLEQLDYVISTQHDDLIDNDKLANDFLDVYDKLGLINEDKENVVSLEGLDESDYSQTLEYILSRKTNKSTLPGEYVCYIQEKTNLNTQPLELLKIEETFIKDKLNEGQKPCDIDKTLSKFSPLKSAKLFTIKELDKIKNSLPKTQSNNTKANSKSFVRTR